MQFFTHWSPNIRHLFHRLLLYKLFRTRLSFLPHYSSGMLFCLVLIASRDPQRALRQDLRLSQVGAQPVGRSSLQRRVQSLLLRPRQYSSFPLFLSSRSAAADLLPVQLRSLSALPEPARRQGASPENRPHHGTRNPPRNTGPSPRNSVIRRTSTRSSRRSSSPTSTFCSASAVTPTPIDCAAKPASRPIRWWKRGNSMRCRDTTGRALWSIFRCCTSMRRRRRR